MGKLEPSLGFEVCAVVGGSMWLLATLRYAGAIGLPWWSITLPLWGLVALLLATGAALALLALAASLFEWGRSRLEALSNSRRARQRRAVTEIMKERNRHG